jgi:hypothetical protein
MKRTQIYLDEDTVSFLEKESGLLHRSMSDIIRESIREKQRFDANLAIRRMKAISGIWKSRHFDTDEYVRNLRKDRSR